MRFNIRSWLQDNRGKATLLGFCAMSSDVIRAALQEAAEWNFVPMFLVTPRQVDANRGYIGSSQEELVDFIESEAKEIGYAGPIWIARDHGGPYQSNRDRGRPEVGLEDAMSYAKEMFSWDLRSGFNILHVDATEDPTARGALEIDEVTRRTAELITYIENIRKKENLPNIYYEVGTEEISGGITEPSRFEKFIQSLKNRLMHLGYGQTTQYLLFLVGQVGTTMRIDMSNKFDSQHAKTLADIAHKNCLFLKVHYADWLETQLLDQFPRLGIGAANVGPEFAAAVVEALAELERKEIESLPKGDKKDKPSKIMETIEEAAIEGAPWHRFEPKALGGQELKFAQAHRREIALCVGRYVMGEPRVVRARQKLYQNVKKYGSVGNPHEFVIEHVRKAIRRYVLAFNLPTSSR